MNAGQPIPPRVLLALTAAVLAGHLWLLRPAPPQLRMHQPLRAPAFATRSISDPPAPRVAVAPAPPAPAAAVAAPAVARRRAVAARATLPPPAASELAAPSSGPPQAPVSSVRIAPPMHLGYQVTAQVRRRSWQGRSELQWQHDGDRYEARMEISAPGQPGRVQHSTGRIEAHGLAPVRFSDKSRAEQATHFERDADRVSFSNNRPPAPLLAGAQDRLSVMLQLGAMLAATPDRYPPGSTVTVQTASTQDAAQWLFTIADEELLQLPGGTAAAVKLIRAPRHEYDHRIELWLAPGLDYVPVRLRLTQPNGDWVDHQWSSTDRR